MFVKPFCVTVIRLRKMPQGSSWHSSALHDAAASELSVNIPLEKRADCPKRTAVFVGVCIFPIGPKGLFKQTLLTPSSWRSVQGAQ